MSEDVHVVCPRCGQVNRIAAHKPARKAKCGACASELFSGRPVDVDSRRFQRHLERDSIPIVVDFWAPWCGPCRAMAPAFSQVADSTEPRARFLNVNVDTEQELAARLAVQGVPALFVFTNGKVAARQAGAMNATQLQ
jgi:thioredoxin 2